VTAKNPKVTVIIHIDNYYYGLQVKSTLSPSERVSRQLVYGHFVYRHFV